MPDFAAIKERTPISTVVSMLGLKMRGKAPQFRGPCPACRSGGDRALAVNTDKASYYCFAHGRGGDVIGFVAHIRGISQYDAAKWLEGDTPTVSTLPQPHPEPQPRNGVRQELAPLQYLEAGHEAVQSLGVSIKTAEHFAAGYAPKGIMRGRLAIPLHTLDSILVAYVGVAVSEEQSPRLHFPNGFAPESLIFNGHRVGAGELYLVRDPLAVLTAFEAGMENCISFLTETVSAQQFEQLAALMDAKKCESVELC